MVAMAGAGPDGSQVSRAASVSRVVTEAAFQRYQQGARSEVEHPRHKSVPIWNASIAIGDYLLSYNTDLRRRYFRNSLVLLASNRTRYQNSLGTW